MSVNLEDKINKEYSALMENYKPLNKSILTSNEWYMINGVFQKFSIYDESKYSSSSTTLSGLNSIK